MSEWLTCWNVSCSSNRQTGLCKNLGINQSNAFCPRRIEPIESSNGAISLNNFISEENLNKMTNKELMELWGFMLSDSERIEVEYKIKKIINLRIDK